MSDCAGAFVCSDPLKTPRQLLFGGEVLNGGLICVDLAIPTGLTALAHLSATEGSGAKSSLPSKWHVELRRNWPDLQQWDRPQG